MDIYNGVEFLMHGPFGIRICSHWNSASFICSFFNKRFIEEIVKGSLNVIVDILKCKSRSPWQMRHYSWSCFQIIFLALFVILKGASVDANCLDLFIVHLNIFIYDRNQRISLNNKHQTPRSIGSWQILSNQVNGINEIMNSIYSSNFKE